MRTIWETIKESGYIQFRLIFVILLNLFVINTISVIITGMIVTDELSEIIVTICVQTIADICFLIIAFKNDGNIEKDSLKHHPCPCLIAFSVHFVVCFITKFYPNYRR